VQSCWRGAFGLSSGPGLKPLQLHLRRHRSYFSIVPVLPLLRSGLGVKPLQLHLRRHRSCFGIVPVLPLVLGSNLCSCSGAGNNHVLDAVPLFPSGLGLNPRQLHLRQRASSFSKPAVLLLLPVGLGLDFPHLHCWRRGSSLFIAPVMPRGADVLT
jgi:hypothetical protein